MKALYKILLFISLLMIASCSSYNTIIDNSIKQLKNNQLEDKTLKKLEVSESSNDYLLYMQELSRIHFINGNTNKSLLYSKKSTDYYNKLDQKAIINASSTVGTLLSSSFGSDNNLDYTGSDYERSFSYFYSAISYLKNNNIDSALIDIRAASDIQKFATVKREQRIAKAQKEINKKTNYTISASTQKILEQNSKILAGAKDNFLNAYIYYISGNVRELYGDFNNALVDYKLALSINPNNSYLLKDTLRLAKVIDYSYYQDLVKQYNATEVSDYNNKATVLVVYEQGFVPKKEEFKGTIWGFDGSFYTISLPIYIASKASPAKVSIDVLDSNSIQTVNMETITDVYNLAKNDLAEKYPFIIARQVTRVLSKSVVQTIGRKQSQNNEGLGLLMYGIGAVSSLTESADLRSYRTLPHFVEVGKVDSKNTINKIKISVNFNKSVEIKDISVKAGEQAIVYVVDTGNFIYSDVVYKSKKFN